MMLNAYSNASLTRRIPYELFPMSHATMKMKRTSEHKLPRQDALRDQYAQ